VGPDPARSRGSRANAKCGCKQPRWACLCCAQPSFGPELAIDGKEEDARGWAYHGRLEDAAIVFALNTTSLVSEIYVSSGIGMSDHRIVTFRLYYWPAKHSLQPDWQEDEEKVEDFVRSPRNWTYDFGARWRPVEGITAHTAGAHMSIATVGHVVYSTPHRLVSHGHHRYALRLVRPMMARALAMRIERTDAPFANAVLNEFIALGWPATAAQQTAYAESEHALLAAAESDSALGFTSFLASHCRLGHTPNDVLRSMTYGFWASREQPLPPHRRRGDVGLEGVRARGRRNLRCPSAQVWLAEAPVPRLERQAACAALGEGAGMEVLFIGDSRTRQAVVAVLLLLENVLPRLSTNKTSSEQVVGRTPGASEAGAGGSHDVRGEAGVAGVRGGAGWQDLHQVHEAEISFLGPEWKDVAVPSELAANCRYAQGFGVSGVRVSGFGFLGCGWGFGIRGRQGFGAGKGSGQASRQSHHRRRAGHDPLLRRRASHCL